MTTIKTTATISHFFIPLLPPPAGAEGGATGGVGAAGPGAGASGIGAAGGVGAAGPEAGGAALGGVGAGVFCGSMFKPLRL